MGPKVERVAWLDSSSIFVSSRLAFCSKHKSSRGTADNENATMHGRVSANALIFFLRGAFCISGDHGCKFTRRILYPIFPSAGIIKFPVLIGEVGGKEFTRAVSARIAIGP